jgi:hypothetical protein
MYYLSEQNKEDKKGRASSTHGCVEKCAQNFNRKPEGNRPLKDLGEDKE